MEQIKKLQKQLWKAKQANPIPLRELSQYTGFESTLLSTYLNKAVRGESKDIIYFTAWKIFKAYGVQIFPNQEKYFGDVETNEQLFLAFRKLLNEAYPKGLTIGNLVAEMKDSEGKNSLKYSRVRYLINGENCRFSAFYYTVSFLIKCVENEK